MNSSQVTVPPTRIQWHKQSNTLALRFEGISSEQAISAELSAEYLRVHSPSAEVRGHAQSGGELPFGKAEVKITDVRPAGHYALQILFDDGHDSGIYTWRYLAKLSEQQDTLWTDYLKALDQQQKSRFPDEQVVKFF